jgi:hypothetical protein
LAELARPALAGDEEGDDIPYFLFFIFYFLTISYLFD